MRILVVEDDPILLDSVAQSLREAGYAVDEANNGSDGFFKANTWDYDAILLDWMLPEMNGIELLRKLRIKKSTPVLLLTARDAVSDRVIGLDQGADDYLVKPYSLIELLARVRSIIRRSAGHGTNQVAVGPMVIDLGSKTITSDGLPIVLTAREFAILELLALHRNKVVSRTTIYDHIFDEDDDSLSNLVDVHVSNLRKKIGKKWIETRRGQGYILHG